MKQLLKKILGLKTINPGPNSNFYKDQSRQLEEARRSENNEKAKK